MNDFSGVISWQQNQLTGPIPRCLGSVLFDSDNVVGYNSESGLEIQEIIKGITEKFFGALGFHSMIDVSSNRLIGTIPKEITSISKLMELNLSNNHLTRGIPRDIGNLQLLESLDLSNNNFSGTIPQSMSAIPWLSALNLSNNNLHGQIPTGSQLQTLDDPSTYAGNPDLCGFPLPDKCTKLNHPPSPAEDDPDDDVEDNHENMWFYLVIMSGVATGFWGVVKTLVFKKIWRHSYFRFVEETADKIYVPFKVRMNRLRNSLR